MPPLTPASSPVTCWSGQNAATLRECTAPKHEKGMKWVFPKFVYQGCGRAVGNKTTGRLELWACSEHNDDGTSRFVNYSRWLSVGFAVHQFTDVEGLTQLPTVDGLLSWQGYVQGKQYGYKSVLMYAGAPYVVTTHTDTLDHMREARAHTVPRPASELYGVTN